MFNIEFFYFGELIYTEKYLEIYVINIKTSERFKAHHSRNG